jgi:hypothetical protein
MTGRKLWVGVVAATMLMGGSAFAIYSQVASVPPVVVEPEPTPTIEAPVEDSAETGSEFSLGKILLDTSKVRPIYRSARINADQIASPATL